MKSILEQNLKDTVFTAIAYSPPAKALLVFDTESVLGNLLTAGYKTILPDAQLIDFGQTTPGDVRGAIDAMSPGDLVVMVQSSSFRLNEFRFRLELFNRKLKVIEHLHLGRVPDIEHETYVDALAYDPTYYRTLGPKLMELINNAKRIVVSCPGTELVYDTPMEPAKPNLGDYSKMKNVGGMFPIGEVFTEPMNLDGVNGTVKLFGYGDEKFRVTFPPEPVTVIIEKGLIVAAPDAPESFLAILDQIRVDEPVWVRELGFGMNRALTKTRTLVDVGSYERMCGIHLSLGQKHTIYAQAGMPKRSSRYHVDVFVDVTTVTIDGVVVYKDGTYCI